VRNQRNAAAPAARILYVGLDVARGAGDEDGFDG
jgi:hypothetical protein